MLKNIVVLLIVFVAFLYSDDSTALVIDASSHMQAELNGTTKTILLQKSISNLPNDWLQGVKSLTLVGHGSAHDCHDIETISTDKIHHDGNISSIIDPIQPQGAAPLAQALRRALFADEPHMPASVVLISGGEAECDEDPCATARELKTKIPKLRIYTIGVGTSPHASNQLSCIAQATDGEYIYVDNDILLTSAIKVLLAKARSPMPQPTIYTNALIRARYTELPLEDTNLHIHWHITQNHDNIVDKNSTGSVEFPARLGTIHIDATLNDVSIPQHITGDVPLTKRSLNEIIIQIKSGKIAFESNVTTRSGAHIRIYPIVDSHPQEDYEIANCTLEQGDRCEVVLPIGEYIATIDSNTTQNRYNISAEYNKTRTVSLEMASDLPSRDHAEHAGSTESGKVQILASAGTDDKLLKSYIINIYDRDGHRIKSSFCDDHTSTQLFTLPAGRYSMDITYNAYKQAKIPFEITSGHTTDLHVTIGAYGTLVLNALDTEHNRSIVMQVASLRDSKGNKITPQKYDNIDKQIAIQLPAGYYSVDLSYDGYEKHNIQFGIFPDQNTSLEIVWNRLRLDAKCKPIDTNITFEILGDDGRMIERQMTTCDKPVLFAIPYGVYILKATTNYLTKSLKLDIPSGSSTHHIDMMPPVEISRSTTTSGIHTDDKTLRSRTPEADVIVPDATAHIKQTRSSHSTDTTHMTPRELHELESVYKVLIKLL